MQNLIPDVWQVVFAYVSIQGWTVDPNVDSFRVSDDAWWMFRPEEAMFETWWKLVSTLK